MNKDASDFMIQEYDKIASAYFSLRDQINEWFKAYLALIGLPLTVLAAVAKIGSTQTPVSLSDLPEVVTWPLVVVAGLGLFVNLSIVSMRMEMILYARTINGVRRFFALRDQQRETRPACVIREALNRLIRQREPAAKRMPLSSFLILSTSDAVPPFYEAWQAMFWQVLSVGFMDGVVLAVAIKNLARLSWLAGFAAGGAYCLFHLAVYRYMAWQRERRWVTRFSENVSPTYR